MTALMTAASWSRICFCWCGGKTATMRLIVSVASIVWSVEKTRWPVSAATSAVSTVSKSRISPTRMTSGSWRRAARIAAANDRVSTSSSRWLMIDFLSRWRNSTGSSTVMMCSARTELMKSIIAASEVDFPEPVVPVTRTSPRVSSQIFSRTGGRRSSRTFRIRAGITRHTIPTVPRC